MLTVGGGGISRNGVGCSSSGGHGTVLASAIVVLLVLKAVGVTGTQVPRLTPLGGSM